MYEKYLEILRRDLPLGESFDILERKFRIGGRKASMFFTDGLTNGQNAQFVLNYLLISPIRKIIRKRKDNVEGLLGEIEAFVAERQQLLDEYESELRKAREAAAIYRKDGKVMGELERARIFDAASKDAQSEVRTTQAAVRADAGVTRRALQAKMHEFTEAAMAKLLA